MRAVRRVFEQIRYGRAWAMGREINRTRIWTASQWGQVEGRAGEVELVWSQMSCGLTRRRATYAGDGVWTVDYLPGRQLTKEQARAAMQIAAYPRSPEVVVWAAQLEMSASKARRLARWGVG